jgi:hypothetical protein
MLAGVARAAGPRAQLTAAGAAAQVELRLLRAAERAGRRAPGVRRRQACTLLTPRAVTLLHVALELGCPARYSGVLVGVLMRGRFAGTAWQVRADVEAEGRRRAACHAQRARAAALIVASPGSNTVLKAAQLLAELRVAAWLRAANDRGVAPSRSKLVIELLRGWPSAADGARAHARATALRTRQGLCRHWARPFRVRWAVTWRRRPARGDLDAATVRNRVARQKAAENQTPSRKVGPSLGPKSGPTFWPPFWVPSSYRTQ